MDKKIYLLLCFWMMIGQVWGQAEISIEDKPLKLKHAEPLYMDLIRDLGARKGEKEVNVGLSYGRDRDYKTMGGFMEYEFAVANRWGMEVEADFSFYKGTAGNFGDVPRSRFDGLRWANQYTFLVSDKWQTSMAVAFIHEFRFHSFYTIHHQHQLGNGTTENPILIVAKRWGKHLHSMIYTGPEWNFTPGKNNDGFGYQLHTSVHYAWNGGHFFGLECNQEQEEGRWNSVLHPQFKWVLSKKVALGLLTGLPLRNTHEKISFMTRLVVEP